MKISIVLDIFLFKDMGANVIYTYDYCQQNLTLSAKSSLILGENKAGFRRESL